VNAKLREIGIEEAASLIRRVGAVRAAHAPRRCKRIATLLRRARSVVSDYLDQLRTNAPRLNLFSALGICDDEFSHSRFLAFLLDPAESHDQRALFLHSFLARFAPRLLASPGDLHAAFVRREFAAGSDRPDIVVFLPGVGVLCIENKTWSKEGPRQIARYQDWLASQGRGTKQLVFLTPAGREPRTAKRCAIPVTPVSYGAIAEWLRSLESAVPQRLRIVLEMHAEACLQLHQRKSRLAAP
jgi:hypothetical protein